MPTYFRFGIGPFRFSQRLGRTQAQKRAAAKARAQRKTARAQRQDAKAGAAWKADWDRAQRQGAEAEKAEEARKADQDRRSFSDVPAHDVTHGENGFTSFALDPPGFPQLEIRLEDGHFSTHGSLWGREDLTWIREGDRVSGTISSDHHSLESLWGSLADKWRYTWVGWAEDIKRDRDGTTTFTVRFRTDIVVHLGGREPVTVTLKPGEKVRWDDGRPYRLSEGSTVIVVFTPEGGIERVYHQAERA